MTTRSNTPPSISPPLPVMRYRTSGLPEAEAYDLWGQLMAPMFRVEQAPHTRALPRGNMSVFIVGEFMANRCTFNAQRLTRDRALIATTPHHLVLQYYRSGGFRGLIAGRPVRISRGQVAVADLGQEVDTFAAASDTIGLSVPRVLLGDVAPDALTEPLDAPRNQLLGSWMAALPKRLAQMTADDVPAVTSELTGLLARVFARGPLSDGILTEDRDLLDCAVRLIDANLGDPELLPALMAKRLGASRAALYRVFAPMGGIMRHIQEQRLLAVRDCLTDPLDARPLTQISAAFGFASPALLSRRFSQRFGMTARDWRRLQTGFDLAETEQSAAPIRALWKDLGHRAAEPKKSSS